MAIRLEDDISAVLTVLAQLEATTVADLIRQAIEALIALKSANPDVIANASSVVDAIEAEASAKKEAIQSLLAGNGTPTKARTARKSG